MKKSIFITTAIAVLASALFFVSCGAQIDAELYDQTIGKKTETTPPGDVKNLKASAFTNAVSLQWENPSDRDFYGLTISCFPPSGILEQPITYINSDVSKIPNSFSIDGLSGRVSYTFTVVTFDDNMNYSQGSSISAKPDGDETTMSGNFLGVGDVFAYKKSMSAYDFGYCGEATTKTIEISATDYIDASATVISSEARMGQSKFEIISIEPTGTVKIGDKLYLTIKYTPAATPCWDEVDVLIGGKSDSKLRLIGSNFKQPKNISSYDEKKDKKLGLCLWLRADMITNNDLANSSVIRIPDYSGRGIHAYCTDTKTYIADYLEIDKDFNNMPSVVFETSNPNTKKAQYLCMSSAADPIIDSGKGSTTFVVVRIPSNDKAVQTVVSSNYGQTFPILTSQVRYVNETLGYGGSSPLYGWGIRGSGLKGDYRYPFMNNKTDDDENVWLSFDKFKETKLSSICMIYNHTESIWATKNAEGRYDFPSNIRMQVDGQERLLSYLYSNSSKTDNTYAGTSTTCAGAYNKPVSDGKGHRYGTLSEAKTPTTAEYENKSGDVFKRWDAGRVSGTRVNDWSYTYNPYEYINEEGKIGWAYEESELKSYASTDDNCPNAAYFTNWISNEERRNGTVYSMFIGNDNIIGKFFRGRLAEVIMFDYPLSDEEIDIVNNYIYYRYKIGTAK